MSEHVPDLPDAKSKKRTAIEVASEGALGAIPFVGSLMAATLSACFSATQENRTREWMEEMAEVVDELLDRVEGLEVQDLASSHEFYDAAVAAARIATATSAKEKHQALQNALFIIGMGDGLDADKRMIFLRYVNELTPSHMRFLRFLDNPPRWFIAHGLTWPSNITSGGLINVVQIAFPEWAKDRPFVDTIATELAARSLIDNPGLHTMMSANGLTARRTSEKGRELMMFISGPFNASAE